MAARQGLALSKATCIGRVSHRFFSRLLCTADAPRPEIDPTKGTLDHFAINLAPYDAEAVTEYLTAAGHAPYAQGRRYGADGDGYSIYLTDPEGTVVELKSGN